MAISKDTYENDYAWLAEFMGLMNRGIIMRPELFEALMKLASEVQLRLNEYRLSQGLNPLSWVEEFYGNLESC